MHESEKDPVLSDAERQSVYSALESILATEKFEAAPQMSAFLRYVVEQAANGNQSRIKAFTVAVDALGKPETFDPQNDPVVRVLAGRLRAALSAYNDENTSAPLMITMTPGSYVPTFLQRTTTTSESVEHCKSDDCSRDRDLSMHCREASSNVMQDSANEATALPDELNGHSDGREHMNSSETDSETLVERHGNNDSDTKATTRPVAAPGRFAYLLGGAPRLVLTGALLGSLFIMFFQNRDATQDEPDMHAAMSEGAAEPVSAGGDRPRPDGLSLFISAVDKGNALENSLNAIISSIISESARVKVYRILHEERETRFWPEDYLLSMTALDLPAEIRINMQLMEAATGRIVHSEVVSLNEQAFERLTEEELSMLTDSAMSIVSEYGPLVTDYSAKKISKK